MDTTERIINAGLKGAIFGAFIMLVVFGIKALHAFFTKKDKEDAPIGSRGVEFKEINTINRRVGDKNIKKPHESRDEDNEIWAAALSNYERRRDAGIYAKLFAKFKGDENRIKAEYIEIKYIELKEKARLDSMSAADRFKSDPKRKQESSAANIKMGAYESRNLKNIDYLILANGNVALRTPSGYRIYDTESSAIKSIDYKSSGNMFLTKGLIEIISFEDLREEKNACPRCRTKNAMNSSTCRKCSLDLRTRGPKNKWVADSNCPNCNAEVWSMAEECWSCGANFGRTSSYKPIMK